MLAGSSPATNTWRFSVIMKKTSLSFKLYAEVLEWFWDYCPLYSRISGVCNNLGMPTEQVLCMIITPGKFAWLACFTEILFAHILNSQGGILALLKSVGVLPLSFLRLILSRKVYSIIYSTLFEVLNEFTFFTFLLAFVFLIYLCLY